MQILGRHSGNRDNNLNLLRLIAASLVIFGHSYTALGPQGKLDFIQAHVRFLSAGHLAVQVFFVISGFLVAQSFYNKPNAAEFLTARILRIFPGLFVALTLTICFGAFITDNSISEYVSNPKTLDYLIHNFILDTRWDLPGVFTKNSFPNVVNASLWTLAIEFKLYLILMLIGVSGVLNSRPTANISAALFIFFHLQKTATYHMTSGDANVDDVMFCFLLGVIFFVNRDMIVLSIRWGILLLLVTIVSAYNNYYTFATIQFCIAYFVFILAYHEKLQINIFRNADYSYGLYIYGFPIQQALAQTGMFHDLALFVVACFLATLPMAMVSWYCIEKPALRMRGQFRKFYALHRKVSS